MSEKQKNTETIVDMVKRHLGAKKDDAPHTVIIFPDFLKSLATAVETGDTKDGSLDAVFADKLADVVREHQLEISENNNEDETTKALKSFKKNTLSEFMKACAAGIKKLKINDLAGCSEQDKEKIAGVLEKQYKSFAGFTGSFWQKYISPYWKNFENAFIKYNKKTADDLTASAKKK